MNVEVQAESRRLWFDSYPAQLISAFMFAIAVALLAGVTRFIMSRPTSALRFVTILPGSIGRSRSVGIIVGAAAFVLIRYKGKSYLGVAVTLLVIGLGS